MDQVKIRGYRVEPGEIEQALLQIPGINQSCVIVRERLAETGSIKYLAAYYVLDGDIAAPTQEVIILDKLSAVLPEYMIPGALVAMGALPLTINGKLDKEALPDPDFNFGEKDLMLLP